MPGFDTNRFVNDAWGVRDIFGSGRMGTSYANWMTKPRSPWTKLWPPNRIELWAVEPRIMNPHEYRLLPVTPVDWENASIDDGLRKLLERNSVGSTPEQTIWRLPAAYFRRDLGPMWGVTMWWWQFRKNTSPDELPIFGGHLGFKVDFGYPWRNQVNFGIIYTPSLSRWVDWYFTTGINGDDTATRFALEAGIQLRPVNPNWGIINQLFVRIGAKDLVYNSEFTDGRIVFEVGGSTY